MTIIGDFQRQKWFVRESIVYRTRLRGIARIIKYARAKVNKRSVAIIRHAAAI